MNWVAPIKPAEYAEQQLINAILDGDFPVDANLPAERDLAGMLGVTRPTLREALQRLARDGWLEIRHGKATRVRDYWHEGSLGVLGAIASRPQKLPPDFIANLLAVRLLLAPAYIRQAVETHPLETRELLEEATRLSETPQDFAIYDWRLHHRLSILSGNPIFTLILNGFATLYQPMACRYFESATARETSRRFYADLLAAIRDEDPALVEQIARQVMARSQELWEQAVQS